MKRALVSVSDKTGIIEFCKELTNLGYEIISTGGTKTTLEQNNIQCISISDITGFDEILDGRVKTLHPKVHGGLLSIRNNPEHQKIMKKYNIDYIDMVVVNLYPFKKTISKPDVLLSDAIENIDIGGPSMLRSAAKNHADVTVLCDNSDFKQVIDEIKQFGDTTMKTRQKLAAKVFRHTASYDCVIAEYLTNIVGESDPSSLTMTFDKVMDLRYGENPHQKATFYKNADIAYSLANCKQLQGKELSYNNIQDANAALEIIKEFSLPTAVALKHMNPCGVATANDILSAYKKCYECDTVSIFGGIVCLNGDVNEAVATELVKTFLEIVIAPSFSAGALEVFKQKANLRVLTTNFTKDKKEYKKFVSVNGGMLVQDCDNFDLQQSNLKVVTKVIPSQKQIEDMLFMMKVCKHVKSNAITVGFDNQVLGVGAGQMNRVGSAFIALEQAKGRSAELVMASDAYFPFNDVVKMAHEYNVTAIIQPGGSIRDNDSIELCNKYGIGMVFTDVRHFKH